MPENSDKAIGLELERPAKAPGLARLDEDAVLIGDTSGFITEVNATLCGLTGYRRSELIGRDGTFILAPEWIEFSARQRQRKVETLQETTRYDCVLLSKSGATNPRRSDLDR